MIAWKCKLGKRQGLTPVSTQPHNEAKGAKAFCSEKAFGNKGMTCFANIAVMASVLFALFTTDG
jgi:hypothetical protein